MWIANPIPFHQKRLPNVIQTCWCHNHQTMIDVELCLVVLSCYLFYCWIIAVIQPIHHQTTLHIPNPIESYLMQITILIDNWFESYFNVLLYLSLMYYEEYIINWIITSIAISITNVKDVSPGRDVSLTVFNAIFIIIDGLWTIVVMIMDIQPMIIVSLYMMYVIIYLFVFDCILLLCLICICDCFDECFRTRIMSVLWQNSLAHFSKFHLFSLCCLCSVFVWLFLFVVWFWFY